MTALQFQKCQERLLAEDPEKLKRKRAAAAAAKANNIPKPLPQSKFNAAEGVLIRRVSKRKGAPKPEFQRKRGRPRKTEASSPVVQKRKRGRPRKTVTIEASSPVVQKKPAANLKKKPAAQKKPAAR